MANLSTPYTIAGSSTVILNNGTVGSGSTDDIYLVHAVHGLDGPTLRTPVDDVPYGHGGLVHKFWKGPRHVSFEGVILVQSWIAGSARCEDALDSMEYDLNLCLDSLIDNSGTLSWTSSVAGALSLTVNYEGGVDIQPIENFALRSFSFGLVSAAADPA